MFRAKAFRSSCKEAAIPEVVDLTWSALSSASEGTSCGTIIEIFEEGAFTTSSKNQLLPLRLLDPGLEDVIPVPPLALWNWRLKSDENKNVWATNDRRKNLKALGELSYIYIAAKAMRAKLKELSDTGERAEWAEHGEWVQPPKKKALVVAGTLQFQAWKMQRPQSCLTKCLLELSGHTGVQDTVS